MKKRSNNYQSIDTGPSFFILNSFILNKNYDHLLQNKENENLHITKLFFILFIQTFLIIIIIFYIQKLVLVIPSIPHLLYPSFVPHTTSEISLHIALIYVFLELFNKMIKEPRPKALQPSRAQNQYRPQRWRANAR